MASKMSNAHQGAMLVALACVLVLTVSSKRADMNNGRKAFVLSLPLDCFVGRTCFVQQYFDHDPSPAAKDYRCGSRVYDGHDGVDIRLSTLAAQRAGVAVLVAADGTVRADRNDQPDHLVVSAADRATIKGRECGNGVLIAHPDGWETQYCHFARGSVRVSPGQQVKVGEKLGLVGLSGDTQFPHVHLSVRHEGRKVDPFAPELAPNSCRSGPGATLWSPIAVTALAYRQSEIINSGFATGPVSIAEIDDGSIKPPARGASAIVFYGRAIGLQAGDQVIVDLAGPSGDRIAHSSETLDRDKAQWMSFAGVRRPADGWRTGTYRATWRVLRKGSVASEVKAQLPL